MVTKDHIAMCTSNSCNNIGSCNLPYRLSAYKLIYKIPSGELKAAQARNLQVENTSVFIKKLTRFDCGL